MFPRLPLRPFDCPYLFACVFGVKIVEQVTERSKIVVTFCAVYPVIDCDISYVTLYEKDFRKKISLASEAIEFTGVEPILGI